MSFDILVTDRVQMKGIGAMNEASKVVDRFAVTSLESMLKDDWAADTHFVTYKVIDAEGKTLPEREQFRLRKTILGQLTEAGGRVMAWGFVGDWDLNENVPDEALHAAGWDGNPKKRPKLSWTRELLDTFAEQMAVLVSLLRVSEIGPAYVYLTNHGARFIHCYDQDLDVVDHEAVTRGMIAEYAKHGHVLDKACVDWTRMFRAPRVVRNKLFTGEQGWFQFHEFKDTWLVTSLAPRVTKTVDDYVDVPDYIGDQPTADEVNRLLFDDLAEGRRSETFKQLKSLLHRRDLRELFDILIGKTVALPEGSRDRELTSLAGQLAAHIYEQPWSSPELMFAVLLPLAEQLEPDAQTPNWPSVAWSLCTRMWTREISKGAARLKVEQAEAEIRADSLESLLTIMKDRYPQNAQLHADDIEAFEELQRMGLVKIGNAIFVLRPDGYYTPQPVDSAVLPGSIRDLGMEFLMPTQIIGKRGGIVEFDARALLMTHGRSISTIVGTFGRPGSYLDGERLMRPLFTWARHDAVHSEWVNTWLQMLGGKRWKDLTKWIAYAQDMRRPICALALVGPRGVGKGLLARGLQELISGSPVSASGSDLVESFTPALIRSPFLIVDEGLPVGTHTVRDVADTFRRMVAGEPIWVNTKFQPQIEVHIPFRVLFTANNREIVHGLVGHRTLSPEDRAALAERIKFIELDERAATWLRVQGGQDFTSGWVAGDGQPSNFVVARHFRWLYENREELFGPPDSDRFLVAGDMTSSIVDELRVLSGVTPEVARACVYLVHTANLADDIAECISMGDDGVWVTTQAIIAFYNSQSTMDKKVRLNEKNVSIALENLTTSYVRMVRKTARGTTRQLRWRRLDIPFLLKHAQNHGLPTERLEVFSEVLK